MRQRIVVIGAGIVGAAIAHGLAAAGHHVTIVDRAGQAGGSSAQSFGWINASFFADEAYFHLRAEGIAAWRRLDGPGITWCGSLWFEEDGAGLDKMLSQLVDFQYPVELIDKEQFTALEPHVADAPARALRLPSEAAADAGIVTQTVLTRAQALGATALFGVEVLGIETRNGGVQQVETSAGTLPADNVIVAAGTGTPALVEPLGIPVPMLRRPGLLITTRAVPPVLSHILVAPGQELRQMPDGRLLAPTSPNHQADEASDLTSSAQDLAEVARARVARLIPAQPISIESTALAFRPVPQDGLPVIGAAGPDGLYIATMHSGVTLAAIVGELVTQEITYGEKAALLAPYRPDRFAG